MYLDIRRGFQLLLSRTRTAHFLNAPFFERAQAHSDYVFFSDPAGIRTQDPLIKSQVLSSLSEPAELRGHSIFQFT